MKAIPSLLLALVSIGISTLPGLRAHADVHVSTTDIEPAQEVVFSVAPATPATNFSWNGPVPRRDIGISFRVPADTDMNTITLVLADGASLSHSNGFRISIHEANAHDTSPASEGGATEVYTATGTLPSSLKLSSPYITFTLDRSVWVQAKNYYVIVLSFSPGSGANSVGFAEGAPPSGFLSQIWHGDVMSTMERIGGRQIALYLQNRPDSSP